MADFITVTLNPAVDVTLTLSSPLQVGEVIRCQSEQTSAGGKGLNVATALSLSAAAVATGLLGERNARLFEQHMAQSSIEDRFIRTGGATRINRKILGSDGQTTDINSVGFTCSEADLTALKTTLSQLASSARSCVVSGSLPPGMTQTQFEELLFFLRPLFGFLAVDVSVGLKNACHAQADLIKPNDHELAQAYDLDDLTTASLESGAQKALSDGAKSVLISRGARGALFAAPGCVYEIRPLATPFDVSSSAGAGDNYLAGYLSALEQPMKERFVRATSYAFSCLTHGPAYPNSQHLPASFAAYIEKNLTINRCEART